MLEVGWGVNERDVTITFFGKNGKTTIPSRYNQVRKSLLGTDYYLTPILRDWLLLCSLLFTVSFFFIVYYSNVLVAVWLKKTVGEPLSSFFKQS